MVRSLETPLIILLLYSVAVMPQVISETWKFGIEAGVSFGYAHSSGIRAPGNPDLTVQEIPGYLRMVSNPAGMENGHMGEEPQTPRADVRGTPSLARSKTSMAAALVTAISLTVLAFLAGTWIWNCGRIIRRKTHHA